MTGQPLAGIKAVPTPATRQFLAALERGDWDGALSVVDEHWMEIWFALDPTDLQRIVSQAPPELLATLKSVNYLARATGFGPVEDLHEPEAAPARGAPPARIAQYIADLRLRGRPVQAMTVARRHQPVLPAKRGQLVDGSGGTSGLVQVHAGITALLAEDATTAIGMLLAAVDTHRPDRFPFVVREATAKLALAHAVAGNIREATALNERARQLDRTESWAESMVDDSIWLTDYICAVDTLDPRAEQLRQEKASPMLHREFWPVALIAQVRHLTLTNRAGQAAALCEAVAATGMPPADADGMFATALSDARFIIGRPAPPTASSPRPAPSPSGVLAQAVELFTTGQLRAVLDVELPPTYDERLPRCLALIQAQAAIAKGPGGEGRRRLLSTLRETLDQHSYGALRFLTRETLDQISDTVEGARAAELVERHTLPTLEVRAVLSSPLSPSELEVLELLRAGLRREEMAEQLFRSLNTVKTQLRSAYRKLDATNRREALERLAQLGH